MRTYREIDTSETFEVQGPNFTTGCSHGPTELARIVAAGEDWLFAHSDHLVDADLVVIAATIGDAAAAMTGLGWFDGDGNDETWVVWSSVPHEGADKANAIRVWLEQHPVAETSDGSLY